MIQLSHIISRQDCIQLTMDPDASVNDMINEAKQVATAENKMVAFAVYNPTVALFNVTKDSDPAAMLAKYEDWSRLYVVIT